MPPKTNQANQSSGTKPSNPPTTASAKPDPKAVVQSQTSSAGKPQQKPAPQPQGGILSSGSAKQASTAKSAPADPKATQNPQKAGTGATVDPKSKYTPEQQQKLAEARKQLEELKKNCLAEDAIHKEIEDKISIQNEIIEAKATQETTKKVLENQETASKKKIAELENKLLDSQMEVKKLEEFAKVAAMKKLQKKPAQIELEFKRENEALYKAKEAAQKAAQGPSSAKAGAPPGAASQDSNLPISEQIKNTKEAIENLNSKKASLIKQNRAKEDAIEKVKKESV